MKVKKKTDVIDTHKVTLLNPDNYNQKIKNTSSDIIIKYVSLVVEYMKLISSRINMRNHTHFRFIIDKGVETLSHIFSLMFFYTKNLEVTSHHTERAYYFYIEFMEQISDDQITFLKLSSKEAVLFAYKKTIYDLHQEYKNPLKPLLPEEKEILSTVDAYKKLNKIIINSLLYNNVFINDNKIAYIKTHGELVHKLNIKLLNSNLNLDLIECIYIFSCKISNIIISSKNDTNIVFFDTLLYFINKLILYKKSIDLKDIIKRINLNEIDLIIDNKNADINNDINKYIFNETK